MPAGVLTAVGTAPPHNYHALRLSQMVSGFAYPPGSDAYSFVVFMGMAVCDDQLPPAVFNGALVVLFLLPAKHNAF